MASGSKSLASVSTDHLKIFEWLAARLRGGRDGDQPARQLAVNHLDRPAARSGLRASQVTIGRQRLAHVHHELVRRYLADREECVIGCGNFGGAQHRQQDHQSRPARYGCQHEIATMTSANVLFAPHGMFAGGTPDCSETQRQNCIRLSGLANATPSFVSTLKTFLAQPMTSGPASNAGTQGRPVFCLATTLRKPVGIPRFIAGLCLRLVGFDFGRAEFAFFVCFLGVDFGFFLVMMNSLTGQ